MQVFKFSSVDELRGMIDKAMRVFPDSRPGQAMCKMYHMDEQTKHAIDSMESWHTVYGYLLHQSAYTKIPESFYPPCA